MANLDGMHWIMANLLYGAGLRSMECLRLRVKDIDFDYQQIAIRNGKGKKDRATMLPEIIESHLQQQLEKAKVIHLRDLTEGYGEVYLPNSLERKYPCANKERWKMRYQPGRYVGLKRQKDVKIEPSIIVHLRER